MNFYVAMSEALGVPPPSWEAACWPMKSSNPWVVAFRAFAQAAERQQEHKYGSEVTNIIHVATDPKNIASAIKELFLKNNVPATLDTLSLMLDLGNLFSPGGPSSNDLREVALSLQPFGLEPTTDNLFRAIESIRKHGGQLKGFDHRRGYNPDLHAIIKEMQAEGRDLNLLSTQEEVYRRMKQRGLLPIRRR